MPPRCAKARIIAKLATAAILALIGCSACGPAGSHPSLASCASFGVHAIKTRMTVRAVPGSCAGLSREQLNEAVASAVRRAVGPHPKAVGRRLALRDSRYLARLVTTVPPQPPASLAASPAQPSGGTKLDLSALACWVLTAAAGSYLFVRVRAVRRSRLPRLLVIGHVTMAASCLAALAAFAVSAAQPLAWVAVGLVITAAGLGMATLVTGLPEPRVGPAYGSVAGSAPAHGGGPATASKQQSLVVVIAVHGVLATATILLVLLAAIGGA